MQCHLAQASIAITREQRFLLPDRLVNVHSRTIVAKYGLGHESDRLAMFLATFLMTYLGHQTIGCLKYGRNLTPNSH